MKTEEEQKQLSDDTKKVCPVCGSSEFTRIVVTVKLSLTVTTHDEIISEITQDIRAWKCDRKHRHVDDEMVIHVFNNLSDAMKHNLC